MSTPAVYLGEYDQEYIKGYVGDLYRRLGVASTVDEKNRIMAEINKVGSAQPWITEWSNSIAGGLYSSKGGVSPGTVTNTGTGTGVLGTGSIIPGAGGAGVGGAGGMMGFGSPEAYAAEIKRKQAAGIAFTNPTEAQSFMSANPGLFGGAAGGGTPGGGAPSPPILQGTDPLSQAINKLLSQYQSAVGTPFTYDPQSDPAYQAASKQAGYNANLATENAAAELAARGILPQPGGVSTMTGDRMASIQQDYFTNALSSLIPGLESNAFNKRQAGIGDLSSLINTLMGQQATQTGQANTAFDQAMRVWEMSGKAPGGIPGVTPGTSMFTTGAGTEGASNFRDLMQLWEALGTAPAGIPGVAEGTAWGAGYNQPVDPAQQATITKLAADYKLDLVSAGELNTILSQTTADVARATWVAMKSDPTYRPSQALISAVERAIKDKWPQQAAGDYPGSAFATVPPNLLVQFSTWNKQKRLDEIVRILRLPITATMTATQKGMYIKSRLGATPEEVQQALNIIAGTTRPVYPGTGPR